MIKQIAPLILLILAMSCTKKNDDKPSTNAVIFQMDHHIDGSPLVLNNIQYTNAFGNSYSVSRLQYFISDIRLTAANGDVTHIDTAFYVDAADAQTTTLKPSIQIPSEEYVAVQFVFGLNEAMNINGAFPNPPENNMEWPIPLGGGYHYMKLEGKVNAGEVQNNFQAHSGPTNGNQNFIQLNFNNLKFIPDASQTLRIIIEMNINNWWNNPHRIDLNDITMVMGNQAIQEQFKANGMDVFSLRQQLNY